MANDPLNRRLSQLASATGTEGTYAAGSDIAANANMEIYDSTVGYPEEGGTDRTPESSSLDPVARIGGTRSFKCDFGTDLIGPGAAGLAADTAPRWATYLQACGFSETIVTTVSQTYAPINSSIPVLDMNLHRDGTLYKGHSCRGTATIEAVVGESVRINFEFMGVREDFKADVANLSSITYPTEDPVAYINVSPSVLGETSLDATGITIALNNEIALRKSDGASTGYRSARITGRAISVEYPAEARAVADFDAWGLLNTEGTLSITIGTVAGNIITISTTKAQLIDVNEDGDRDNIMEGPLTFRFPREDATTVNPFTIVLT